MGGEQLATPPGFHFFVSILILLTGIPLIYAEVLTATIFSSIIVFPAYLVSRRIWKNSNAGLLAAFFAAISALSIEMISWGGYTNIVSLFLIITIFFLFLKDIDNPKKKYLVMGTILFGALILTHTFSLSIVLPILSLYLILLIIGKLRKLKELRILDMLRYFVISASVGALAILPWILRVVNFYISATSGGAITGGLDNRNIILANRTVEPIILTLIIALIPTILFFKNAREKYFDRSTLLIIAWFIVPVIMTQAYIFGIYTDYSRFLYFIDFPGIIIISAGLLFLSRYLTIAINKIPKIRLKRFKKVVQLIILNLMIFSFILASLWSIFPHEAMVRADFYTTIQQPEFTTLKWINMNTHEDSVLIADHLFGWWLGGIGERTTLSAAKPEFLIYAHELEVAKDASLFLQTHYYLDNDLIQLRGPYLWRKNLEFTIETWRDTRYPLPNFRDDYTYFHYEDNNEIDENGNPKSKIATWDELEIIELPKIIKGEDYVDLTITYESDLFIIKKAVKIRQGTRFVELSYDIKVKDVERINLYNVWIPIYIIEDNVTLSRLRYFGYFDSEEKFIPYFGYYDSGEEMCGQVIFRGDIPSEMNPEKEPSRVELLFRYPNQEEINIKMLVGVYEPINPSYPDGVLEEYPLYPLKLLDEDLTPYEIKINEKIQNENEIYYNEIKNRSISDENITIWEYSEIITRYDLDYVVSRDWYIFQKVSEDPKFEFVYNCGNVSIFQLVK